MPVKTPNIGASVRARLLNIARRDGTDFQLVLTRYALERLLYRLGASPYRDRFILKGAMLFTIWLDDPFRPTRDVDLLGYGDNDAAQLGKVFREICVAPVPDDGVTFEADAIQADTIRDANEYGGMRLQTTASIDGARVPIRVDIGFGDAVTPGPADIEYPTLLDAPAPMLRAYPKETVVAEKFEALVTLGKSNTRMKDFYDLWMMSRHFSFDLAVLAAAVRATFDRRKTKMPIEVPVGLSSEFAQSPDKIAQWKAFISRERLAADVSSLEAVVADLQGFLLPVFEHTQGANETRVTWRPAGPWDVAPPG